MKQSTQPNISSRISLREWLVLALMGALMFVLQVALAVLANVEFVTVLIIVVTTVFGWRALVSVYIFVFLEVLFHGLGVWNIAYLYVWAILVIAVMFTRRFANPIINAIIAGFFGLFFGCLCSVPNFIIMGFAGGVAWIISGIPYDLIHCVANFVLVIIAFKPMLTALKKIVKN